MPDPSEFLDENGRWKCTQCGACCLVVGLFIDHPVLSRMDRGDGGCVHLTNKMQCRIYKDRPAICNSRANSPDATELERAEACAGVKAIMDREIRLKARSPLGKKARI